MAAQIFVNLPVKNLDKSVEFFTALGYTFNPQFTDKNATCMIVTADHIYVMLLVEAFFKTFTPKPIADAAKSTEVLGCLSCESRDQVDDMVRKAVAAGGTMSSTWSRESHDRHTSTSVLLAASAIGFGVKVLKNASTSSMT